MWPCLSWAAERGSSWAVGYGDPAYLLPEGVFENRVRQEGRPPHAPYFPHLDKETGDFQEVSLGHIPVGIWDWLPRSLPAVGGMSPVAPPSLGVASSSPVLVAPAQEGGAGPWGYGDLLAS